MIKVYRNINMNQRIHHSKAKQKAKKYRAYYLESDGKRWYLSSFESGNRKTDCYYSFIDHLDSGLMFYKNRIDNILRRLGKTYDLVFEEVQS